MEINEVLSQLTSKFGNDFDALKVTNLLKGLDLSKFSFNDITSLLTKHGLLGDLDGDGKVESPIEEIKGKAEQVLGSIGGIFGK